ncbi:MAG: hypothetical protein SPE18_07405 [Candidatus Limivicinus sp.]|nr:hypothetical protein [Candidatus Limivicinus sp.]
MGFADTLAKRTKTKEQLAREYAEALECRTTKEVERVIRFFKEDCNRAAEEGKHTLKRNYWGETWWHMGERPFDERAVAKRVKAILQQEGFKKLVVRPLHESDYDLDCSIGVKIIVKW